MDGCILYADHRTVSKETIQGYILEQKKCRDTSAELEG